MFRPIHWLAFFLISLFWGGSFLAIKIAVTDLPPFYCAFLRVATCFLGISSYLLIFERWITKPKEWLQAVGIGSLGMGIPWILLFWGEQHIDSALAAILNATTPIFTFLWMPIITRLDRWTLPKFLGVLFGFFGIVLIFYPEISKTISMQFKGMLAVLGMACSYSTGILWTRRIGHRMKGATLLFYQCLGGMTILAIATLVFEFPHDPFAGSLKAYLAILYLGIFSTLIAWLLFFKIVRDIGSLQAAAAGYCVPFVAILLDVFYRGKWITWNQGLGAAVILLSVLLINRGILVKKQK